MTTAIAYLKEHKIFHIATVDKAGARVRPFSFVMVRNNTLYFCTNKTKEVYRQLTTNPNIEISDMGTNGSWIRIRGKVAVDDNQDAKVQAFAEAPELLRIYPKGAQDENFTTFYFTEAETTLFSFGKTPEKIGLI